MVMIKETVEARRALLELYFASLRGKHSNVVKIAEIGNEESLALSCCLIEALATRKYDNNSELHANRKCLRNFSKARAFTEMLQEYSGFDFWKQIFSEAILSYLPDKLFTPNDYEELYYLVLSMERRLYSEDELRPIFVRSAKNRKQAEWFENYICKASMGSLIYSNVRSKLVHDVSHDVFVTEYKWNDQSIPEINSSFMAGCVLNIINNLEEISMESLTFWWEQ
jgi:hypothetical protein